MGDYLNPSNDGFEESINSKIYVDKTGLISYTNKIIRTQQKYICISRPRRFGKTMAANMLTAYYSSGCNSDGLFAGFSISRDSSYKKHLNKYHVIFLNIQHFLSEGDNVKAMIKEIEKDIFEEALEAHPELAAIISKKKLTAFLQKLYTSTKTPIIFIIDEWDCIFRENQNDKTAQKIYLDFLRNLLKDRQYVALAYMTGILPIKKYGTHSALNMFREFSMTDPRELAEFVGFTQNEVKGLCKVFKLNFEEMARWYDGYYFSGLRSVYNPKSVVEALLSKHFSDYWSQTETFEALSFYIKINFNGLKDTIVELLTGEKRRINISNFSNDMVTFKSYEDVLTLLIHLGYLGYEFETQEVFIPNKEISDEFVTAIRDAGWEEIISAINASDELLQAVWRGDSKIVEQCVEKAHNETSILTYNNENALAYVISLAFFNARQYYNITREMPAGKGFADLVFLPRKNHMDKPAMIVELKWDETATSAIEQIENKMYAEIFRDYRDNALLVGINYDKGTKRHECVIKKLLQ